MSAASRFGARSEDRLARALKTKRTKDRPRFESRPDVLPVRLPSGYVVQGESKARRKIPSWLTDAIAQAERYTPNAIALISLFEKGNGEGLAVMRLRDLCMLLGLEQPRAGEQLSLGRST